MQPMGIRRGRGRRLIKLGISNYELGIMIPMHRENWRRIQICGENWVVVTQEIC